MVDKLSVTIALEGGKEIQKQLADIGETGKKAFADILDAAEKAGGLNKLKPEELTQKFKDMGVTGEDAINKITAAVQKAVQLERLVGVVQTVEKGFAGLKTAAIGFASALVPIAQITAVAGVAIVKAMEASAKAINEADASAIKLGKSIAEFDKLRQGMEKAGIGAKAIAEGMQTVASAMEKAKLQQNADAFERLKTLGGGVGSTELNTLEKNAQGFGKAAEDATKKIKELGFTIEDRAVKSLSELTAKFGETAGLKAFMAQLDAMPPGLQRNATALDSFNNEFGVKLVQHMNAGGKAMDLLKEQSGGLTQAMANSATLIEESFNRSAAAWERFKTTGDPSQLGTIFAEMASRVVLSFQQMGQELATFGGKISELASQIGGFVWNTFASAGTTAINAISSALDGLMNKIRSIGSAIAGAFSGGGGTPGGQTPAPGFAQGGPVGGRGTGTSDSNLAWVSRGEYVVPARAVSQPGVLAFLEALRGSGGRLRGILDGMGRYATGGLVAMPRLSAAGGMSHVTIAFPGLPAISGLRASSDVVGELQRAAAMAQVRSGGRKPSRYT